MSERNIVGAGLVSPPNTPPQDKPLDFDVVSYYNDLLTTDPSITAPIAAIESLIATLSSSPVSTISETLSLLKSASSALLRSQSNPIPLSAGTELFQRYIVTSFQQTTNPTQSGSDFTQLRNQLIANSKLFVTRAKTARSKIADYALPLVEDDSTIIVHGNSRAVNIVLTRAADAGKYFHSIFIPGDGSVPREVNATILHLRSLNLPVAIIPLSALSFSLCSLPKSSVSTLFFIGSEAVLENGSSITAIGARVVAEVAQTRNIPVYVTAESYKFVRNFPLSYGADDFARMGAEKNNFEFYGTVDASREDKHKDQQNDMKEIVPPHLISALITENGVMSVNAVAEELIKLWF